MRASYYWRERDTPYTPEHFPSLSIPKCSICFDLFESYFGYAEDFLLFAWELPIPEEGVVPILPENTYYP